MHACDSNLSSSSSSKEVLKLNRACTAQYFLGSSHMWEDHIGAGGSIQLVPLEIALKVAAQIRAQKPFAAYIMLPMWPEGAFKPSNPLVFVLKIQQQAASDVALHTAEFTTDSWPQHQAFTRLLRVVSLTRSSVRAGVPETGSVQEVLFWQTCTIRMMFRIVGDALRDAGHPERHPGDYLIFLTVGECT